ncbi:MAG: hypothetical protein M1831_004022 [Alyxoria varia]|nr:MAG: hypothetical protein M1831_004022 [Alyxoria varia]
MGKRDPLPDLFKDKWFIGRRFEMPDQGSWVLEQKINYSSEYTAHCIETLEVKAVFFCRSLTGGAFVEPGDQAVVKVVPSSTDPKLNRKLLPKGEAKKYSTAQWEISNIEKLLDGACGASVNWANLNYETQDNDMPFPGEYIGYLMMEKISGQSLLNFYQFSRSKRDRIRDAFKKAIKEVHRCEVYPYDRAARNIIYDDQQNKCYIIDFENCMSGIEPGAEDPEAWELYILDRRTGKYVDPETPPLHREENKKKNNF